MTHSLYIESIYNVLTMYLHSKMFALEKKLNCVELLYIGVIICWWQATPSHPSTHLWLFYAIFTPENINVACTM